MRRLHGGLLLGKQCALQSRRNRQAFEHYLDAGVSNHQRQRVSPMRKFATSPARVSTVPASMRGTPLVYRCVRPRPPITVVKPGSSARSTHAASVAAIAWLPVPTHARYFNWWDPVWPKGMEQYLSPNVSPRMRGIVEKCSFCFPPLSGRQGQSVCRRASHRRGR